MRTSAVFKYSTKYSTDSYAPDYTQLYSDLEIELFRRYYKTRTNIIGIVVRPL